MNIQNSQYDKSLYVWVIIMARRRGKGRFESEEEDTMAGTANLVDAMLVIAVGLLVFLVLAWNMQSVLFTENLTPEEKEQVMEAMNQEVTEVQEGQVLNETPDTSNQTGQGYTEMGKVYKDPSTGKMIMVQNQSSQIDSIFLLLTGLFFLLSIT